MPDPWGTDANAGYMTEAQFRASMDSVYGPGKWQETGGWRSQARENALRAQGAQTVSAGAVSAHSLGDQDAPGAHDITVTGMTPAQAAAALKAAGLPVAQAFPEGAAGGQGAHLHVGMQPGVAADPWGTGAAPAADPWATASRAAPTSHGFLEEAGRIAGSFVGGAAEGVGALVKGGTQAFDAYIQQQQRLEGQSGVGDSGEIDTPQDKAAAAQAGASRAPIFAPSGAAVAKKIDQWGVAQEPADRNTAESIAHGAGGFVAPLAAAAIDPLLGAATFGAQGYGQTYDEAVAKGATPEVAERAGTESGALQAGIGMLPVGKVLEPVVKGITQPILAAGARTAAEAAGGAAMGAGMQTGENVVAEQNYDPTRPVFQGVPQAALEMAAGAGAIHGVHEAVGGTVGAVQDRLRSREQPIGAEADVLQMPETGAIRAYAGLPPLEAAGTPEVSAPALAEGQEAPAPGPTAPTGASVLVDAGNGDMVPGTVAAADPTSTTVQTAAGPVQAAPEQVRVLPQDYETARVAEGAPIAEMPAAIADVAEFQNAAPKSYNLFQAMRDLGGIRTQDADGKVDGDVQAAFGGKRTQPGLINNQTGLTPDGMREALQQRGWFGSFDQGQGAEQNGIERPGDNIQDLYDLMDKQVTKGPVVHPATETPVNGARRSAVESEMEQAGVGIKDPPDVAAAKLAAYRASVQDQQSPAMDVLRSRADAAGINHGPDTTYDDLLGDVVEHDAVRSDYDGWGADHDEGLIDAQLTPEEHQWLASPERRAEGESGPPEAVEASGEGPAPFAGAEEGDREPRESPGGGDERSGSVPEGAELDPWAVAPTDRMNLSGERVQQGVLSGAEQSARQAAAARGEVLRPKVAQEDAGGLFASPEAEQNELKFQREQPFYSAAERAVSLSTTKAATPEQWKATLDNAQGVKKEELDWAGVKDWLDLFPKGEKVPKEAVQAFMRDHGVQVKEVVLGADRDSIRPSEEDSAPYKAEWDSLVQELRNIQARAPIGYSSSAADFDRAQAVRDRMGDLHELMIDRAMERTGFSKESAPTQFGDWKLPGGEDYRELLLTLPDVANPPATHWDTPGVMAHVRFDTRTDAGGKKVLFIQEVQSDWHQKGRDQGYEKPADPKLVAEAEEKRKAAGQRLIAASSTEGSRIRQWLRGAGVDEKYIPALDGPEDVRRAAGSLYASREYDKWKEVAPEAHAAFAEAHNETVGARLAYTEARQHAESIKGTSGIANAPFKSSWPALVMKRMIVWAADHGYDKVAWTTGAQQSDRYGLSQHIEGVTVVNDNGQRMWWPKSRSHGTLGGIRTDPDGTITMANREAYGDIVGRNISDVFGHDLAQRGLATTERETHFDGADLDVGGSGMRAFYDRNLVNITNDLIKKYGAKVEKTKVPTADFTELEHFAKSDNGAWRMAEERAERHAGNTGLEPALRESAARAKAAAEQSAARLTDARIGTDQHGFTLTDKMKDAATNGLPLFQRAQARAASGDFEPLTRGLEGEQAAPDDPQRAYDTMRAVSDVLDRLAPIAQNRPFSRLRDEQGGAVEGAAFREKMGPVIAWALDGANAVRTVRHEAVHALRQAGLFRPAEWEALASTARSDGWMDRYGIKDRYGDLAPAMQVEEAIAERFADWRSAPAATDLPSFVKAIFTRVANALDRIADAVRQRFGSQVTAAQVMDMIESGAIGARSGLPRSEAPDLQFQRREEEKDPTARAAGGFINRTLGSGVDAVGEKISATASRYLPEPVNNLIDELKLGVSPMGSGTPRAQAEAKDFANALRTSAYQWSKLDHWLNDTFTPDQQRRMWEAADEEGVLRRRGGTPGPEQGMNRLEPAEAAAVRQLQDRADAAYKQAQTLGMATGEGLESYVPRMVVQMTLTGPKVLERATPGQARRGGNLSTTTGQLRQRKYETVGETEAAAQKAFGDGSQVVRNIRTLALATQRLEQAVAGRTLVNKIKDMSSDAQAALVSEGATKDPAAFFTLDHPALQTWKPKFTTDPATGKLTAVVDQNGETVFEAHPLWVSKEFEGPLKAVLTTPSTGAARALLTLKSKMMGVIMYSPLMHNAVIWGKAIPADPKGVVTFEAYRRGNRAKNDPATMNEALQAGLVPVSQHFDKVDTASIAAGPDLIPGRSWTAQVLAAVPGLFDREAGEAVKRAVDKAGDVWHNKFLWDRVADLQMGLYTHIRDTLVSHASEIGINPQDAQRIAAHYANRYAGALPVEGMSKLARQTANMLLFSRSFTLGNLAVYKDITAGLPSDVRSQILRDSGAEKLARVQGVGRQKALSMLALDVTLSYAGLFLAAGATAWLTHQAFQSPLDNENGKKNRVLLGYDNQGTAIYARLPTGKVAEEMVDWVKDPRQLVINKLSPYMRLAYAMAANDKGYHQQLYYPNDHTPAGYAKAMGNIAWFAAEGIAPVGQLQGASDAMTGAADKKSAELRALAPLAGVTISGGAPGGPANATYMDVKAKHEFDVQQAMPDIRRQIKTGDVQGARAKMAALGIPSGLQNFYVRTTLNPATRLSGRSLRDFEQMATPEEKDQLRAQLATQRARMAAPAPQ